MVCSYKTDWIIHRMPGFTLQAKAGHNVPLEIFSSKNMESLKYRDCLEKQIEAHS